MSTWNLPPGVSTADLERQIQGEPLIVTRHVFPPTPVRDHDWSATISGEEDAPIGRGPTETEALRDLCEQLADYWLRRGGK